MMILSKRWHRLLLMLPLTFFHSGCRGESPPEAPEAPAMERFALNFEEPRGRLDEEGGEALGRWLLGEEGISSFFAATLLGELILPIWLQSTTEGGAGLETEESSGSTENTGGSFEEQSASPRLSGKGWMRLTLPCASPPAEGTLRFQALFSLEGISPILWGGAEGCRWPEEELSLTGDIAFFLPRQGSPFELISWSGPAKIWLDFSGELAWSGGAIAGAIAASFDDETTQLLWEEGSRRFTLSIPRVTLSEIADPSTLVQLPIEVLTEKGSWRCTLEESSCTGPDGQEVQL